jgi:glycerol-3-phosphate acyltransferase PlsY
VVAVLALVVAYLLGSIPFSYLVARRRGIDVRTVGSGNVGATNVMRTAGRAAGIAAFALDFAKGAAATLFARTVAGGDRWPALAAVVAVLGHMYPVWLRFRGGKGVATGAGAFLPVVPMPTAAALLTFAVVAFLSRYVSVGSILGASTLAVLSFALGPRPVAWAATAVAALILWKHRANLRRILSGTENRMGRAPKPAAGP